MLHGFWDRARTRNNKQSIAKTQLNLSNNKEARAIPLGLNHAYHEYTVKMF